MGSPHIRQTDSAGCPCSTHRWRRHECEHTRTLREKEPWRTGCSRPACLKSPVALCGTPGCKRGRRGLRADSAVLKRQRTASSGTVEPQEGRVRTGGRRARKDWLPAQSEKHLWRRLGMHRRLRRVYCCLPCFPCGKVGAGCVRTTLRSNQRRSRCLPPVLCPCRSCCCSNHRNLNRAQPKSQTFPCPPIQLTQRQPVQRWCPPQPGSGLAVYLPDEVVELGPRQMRA
jgi:hypothetical protein